MKTILIKEKGTNKKMEKIMNDLKFASEYFKCENCGYTVAMRVRGDRATCSNCGGKMKRC